jgi:cell division protein FtsB
MNKKSSKIIMPQGKELRTQAIMTVGMVLLIYMVISTTQAFWQHYRLNQELNRLRDKNTELRLNNKYLENLIAYRKTDSFKDKEARGKLNYQKPGEIVLIIPEDDIERFKEGNIKGSGNNIPRELTNPEKWWEFMFG